MKKYTPLLILLMMFVAPLLPAQDAVSVEEAFESIWAGHMRQPSTYFHSAAELLERRTDLTAEERLQVAVLRGYAYEVARYLEYSLMTTPAERKHLYKSQIKLLDQEMAGVTNPRLLATAYVVQATFYFRVKNYGMGRKAADEALKHAPDWSGSHRCLGTLMYNLGDYPSAETYLSKAIELNDKEIDAYYLLGWIYYRTNRENEAIELGDQALKINDQFVMIHNLFAGIYSNYKDYEKTKEEYEKIISKNPKWISAYTNLAWEHNYRDEYSEAIKYARLALEVDPNSAMAYRRIGNAYRYMGTVDSAKVYYNHCIELDSSCYVELGWMEYNKKEYKAAIEFGLKRLSIDSFHTEAYRMIGWSYYRQQEYEQSIPYFESALRFSPTSTGVMEGLAISYGKVKAHDKAAEIWERVVKLEPTNQAYVAKSGYAFAALARKALKEDQPEEASKWLLQGAKLGNRFCRLLASGVMNEYGVDVESDYDQSMKAYKNAGRRVQYLDLAKEGIVRLYEAGKVEMDSSDYKLWKHDIRAVNLKQLNISCITKSGGKATYTIYIFPEYPDNVHPMAWEAERLQEEFGATIQQSVMDSFLKLYQLAKKSDVSFIKMLDYALDSNKNDTHEELKEQMTKGELTGSKRDSAYQLIVKNKQRMYKRDSTTAQKRALKIELKEYSNWLAEGHKYKEAKAVAVDLIQLDPQPSSHIHLAKLHISEYLNARSKQTDIGTEQFFTSTHMAAHFEYFKFFLKEKNEVQANKEKDIILKDPSSRDLFKLTLYTVSRNIEEDHFDNLYAQSDRETLDADLTYLMRRVGQKDNYEEKLKIYDLILRIDLHLLEREGSDSTLVARAAQHYNSTAWYQLLTAQFAESEQTLRKGIALDKDHAYFYTNLPPAVLMQGRFEEAKALYQEWKDKPFAPDDDYATYKDVYLEDFAQFEKDGIIPEANKLQFEEIKKLLEE